MGLFVEEFARACNGEVIRPDEKGNELPALFEKKVAYRVANEILKDVQDKRNTYSDLIKKNPDLAIKNPAFFEYARLLMDPAPDATEKNLATLTYLNTRQGQRDIVVDALTKLRKIAEASFTKIDNNYAEYLQHNYLTYAITPYLTQMIDDLSERNLLSPEILDLYEQHKDAYENTDALRAVSIMANPAYLKTGVGSSIDDARISFERQNELIGLAGEDGNLVKNIVDFETRQAKIRGVESACVGMHDAEFSPDEYTFTRTEWDTEFKKEGATEAVDFQNAFLVADGLKTYENGKVRYQINAKRKPEEEVNRIRNVFANEKDRFVLFDVDKLKNFAKKTYESLDNADFSAFNIFQRSSKEYKNMKASSKELCDVLEAVSQNKDKLSVAENSEKIVNAIEAFKKANEKYITYKEADVKESMDRNNSRLKLANAIKADLSSELINGAIEQNKLVQKYMGLKEKAARIEEERSFNQNNSKHGAIETIKYLFASKLVDSFKEAGSKKAYTKNDFIKGFDNHSEQLDRLLDKVISHMDVNGDGNYSFEKFAQALTNPEDPKHEDYHQMLEDYAKEVTDSIKEKFQPKEAKQDDKAASTELGIGGPLV